MLSICLIVTCLLLRLVNYFPFLRSGLILTKPLKSLLYAALNTDAFTRIRENIQYYFVPFQSLWKYFEQQVNNMTKGDAGQNISKFASSSTDSSPY